MADAAADRWSGAPPAHVFIQGGVGGAAAAVSVQMRTGFHPAPALIVVEPDRAACLLASAELGEPGLIAWQGLDRAATAFMHLVGRTPASVAA